VQPASGQLEQPQVALDRDHLGHGRDPGEPQPAGEMALVHHPALGELGLLGVLDDERIEQGRVGQGPAQHARVGDRPLAIGEGHRTGRLQQAQLGQLQAVQALGHGRHRVDLDELHLPRPARHELDHRRIVDRRVGIGHQREAGDPAGGGRHRAAVDPLLVLGPGLAQLGAHVDQPRRQAEPAGVDHLGTVRHRHAGDPRPHLGDAPADGQEAARPVLPARRVEQPRTRDQERAAQACGSRRCWVRTSSTAIRTARPIST